MYATPSGGEIGNVIPIIPIPICSAISFLSIFINILYQDFIFSILSVSYPEQIFFNATRGGEILTEADIGDELTHLYEVAKIVD